MTASGRISDVPIAARLLAAALAAVLAAALAACGALPTVPGVLPQERGFELVLEGNDSLSDRELERAIAYDLEELERSGFRPAFADDAAYQAQVAYRDRGYPFARVEYELGGSAERPRLVLRIEEGPRTYLDEEGLVTDGVEAFPREQVLAFLEGPRTGFLGRGRLLYVEGSLQAVPRAMVREYRARGYADARVEPPEVTFSEDRTLVRIRLVAHEGPRYLVGSIAWGAGRPPELAAQDCEEILREHRFDAAGEPAPFTARLPFQLRGALREALSAAGYPDAQVEGQVHRHSEPEPRVDLLVDVRAGQRVEIGDVRLEGNERTRESFLRSRVLLESGEFWSGELALESIRRLYRTGLFRRVDLELEGEGARRDLVVRVEEAPSREYFVEPGYGSYELFRLRAGMREKNLFGRGKQVRAEATLAVRAQRALLTFTDPQLLGSDLIGDLTFSYEEREDASFTGGESGVGAFVTKEWGQPGGQGSDATTFGYAFRRSVIDDADVVVADVGADAIRDVDLSSLIVTQRHDRRGYTMRDAPFLPGKGYFVQGSLEWGDDGLGSQLDFLRTTLTLKAYRRLSQRLVLAAAYRTGVIEPLQGERTVPLQERFYNGGENTVRSFMEFELGPKDSAGNPIGGESFSTVNLELRRRLGESPFEAALFADAGVVREKASQWGEWRDVGVGLGLGLRYVLPVGPLRLDVALNPDPEDDEDEVVVHFAIGIAF